MIKVGIVGEDPNDTLSIQKLLYKKYKSKVRFCVLARGIRGHQLDNPKLLRSLIVEYANNSCQFVLFVRDLDGYSTEKAKVKKVRTWAENIDAKLKSNGLLLINIWELEALILADIGAFSKKYGISSSYSGNPMMQREPKEYLKHITRHSRRPYSVSQPNMPLNLPSK
jgi:hypothetical protein